jgi:hypothetical protein
LPQYQKAVTKSRITEMLLLAKRFRDAQMIYFLTNGRYSGDLRELDIDGLTDCNSPVETKGQQLCMYGKYSLRIGSTGNISSDFYFAVYPTTNNSLPAIESYKRPGFECLSGGDPKKAAVCETYGGRKRPDRDTYYYIDF